MGEFTDAIKEIDRTVSHFRGKRTRRYSNYSLTEAGKKKLSEEYSGAGIEWDIMNDLEEHGPSTKQEIAGRIHGSDKATKGALERLIAKQRVIKVP